MARVWSASVIAAHVAFVAVHFIRFVPNETARSSLVAFTQAVSLGDSKVDVLERCLGAPSRDLECKPHDDTIAIFTPSQLPASKRWIAYVDLRDGRVARVRIRSADCSERKPAGAPADRVAE